MKAYKFREVDPAVRRAGMSLHYFQQDESLDQGVVEFALQNYTRAQFSVDARDAPLLAGVAALQQARFVPPDAFDLDDLGFIIGRCREFLSLQDCHLEKGRRLMHCQRTRTPD